MYRSLACFLMAFISFHIASGQKQISYEQAFRDGETGIFKPLPQFSKWVGDNHIVTVVKDGKGAGKKIKINVNTGEQTDISSIIESGELDSSRSIVLPQQIKNMEASPDGQWIAYTDKYNLFVLNGRTQQLFQLTTDGNDSILNGHASWVYYEEILGRNYKAFWWTKNSRHLVFMRFDESHVPVFPLYVSDGQHGHLELQRYPKAGNRNPEVKIGIVDIATKKIAWADFDESKDLYFGRPFITPDNEIWIQCTDRKQEDLEIYKVDPSTGKKSLRYEEHQDTWVSVNEAGIEFLPNKKFIKRSDKSGWAHFYLYDSTGKLVNQITQGRFSVGNIVKQDQKSNGIYFTARKENSARWDLYHVRLDGKNFGRITAGDYSFTNISISPGNKYFVANYSNTRTPIALGVFDMNGKLVNEIGNVKGAAFNDFNLPAKELLRVKSADGLFDLPMTITYPINFDSTKKYPVLMNVYGGPGAGAVYDSWSLSMTDIWWAQEDLIQVSVDNRISGHFGKEGMNYMHRKAGLYEIEDFMAAGRWLKKQQWVDTNKLCITGFSHGGYMTCLGLTYGADVFNYGISYWGNSSWELYDSHYTEKFMDSPQENPEGYKSTSVLSYVSKYKGLLRIVHGTSDDNVHPQHSLQLISKLQESKKHFEFMLYPGVRHGFGGTTPQWHHNKMETYRFYYQNLLGMPLPPPFSN